jgi:hypothetical protein
MDNDKKSVVISPHFFFIGGKDEIR